MSKKQAEFRRPQAAVLAARLAEPRRFLHVAAGPRQVGKSTLVQQVTSELSLPVRYASADESTLRAADWISQQWEAARLQASGEAGAVLVLDEIQKIPAWSETVKSLWDDDARKKRSLKVVLLGSAPLLIAQGLTESLAGRFETLRLPRWSYAGMRQAFDFTLDKYLYFGGYPGATPLIRDPVVKAQARLIAIEVKSGRAPQAHPGTVAFARAFKVKRTLLIGGDGIAVEDFLNRPVAERLAH